MKMKSNSLPENLFLDNSTMIRVLVLVLISFICVVGVSRTSAKPRASVFKVMSSRAEKGEDNKIQIIHSAGTAFAVGKRSVITAAHNVSDRKSRVFYEDIKILTENGWVKCKVSKKSHLDICELELDSDVSECVLAAGDADPGKSVELYGSVNAAPISHAEGKVIRKYHSDLVYTLAELRFDHGCSGGPVISGGRVVGMVVAGVPTTNGKLDTGKCLYLPVQVIRQFLAGEIEE
jgi:hypothetical protein